MTRESETKPRAVFVGDFLHLATPLERHVSFAAEDGLALQPILDHAASSVCIGPGSGLPTWSAEATVGVRRQRHGGSAIDVTWIATSQDSPVHRIDAVLSVESAGLDHARIGIEAGAGIASNRDAGDARWLTEELCRAALRELAVLAPIARTPR